MDGAFRVEPDSVLLAAAMREDRILVTYDLKTIPALLREWADIGQPHAGIVLIDDQTIRQNDVGGLIRALLNLVHQMDVQSWRDRVEILRR